MPPETNDINVVLQSRGLAASSEEVKPCVVAKDGSGKHAVQVNTKWFEIQEIVLTQSGRRLAEKHVASEKKGDGEEDAPKETVEEATEGVPVG